MNRIVKKLTAALLLVFVLLAFAAPAFAETDASEEIAIVAEASSETADSEDTVTGIKIMGVCMAIAVAAGAGAISMGIMVYKSNQAISRQPEAASQIRSSMMLGLVFVETAIIYALIVAILVIFVM